MSKYKKIITLIFRKIIIYIRFISDFIKFRKLSAKNGFRFPVYWQNIHPCLNDRTSDMGFDSHYIYHTAWAARILSSSKPILHVDISSSLYFASIVSAFIPIDFYDYRQAKIELNNLKPGTADMLALPFLGNSIDSLSCMHVVEHIGLGRYGDQLDPDGDLKAMKELKRVVSKNGNLLFVVPIGHSKIMFNAHRIYSYAQIMEYYCELDMVEFSLVTDEGLFIRNASKEIADRQKYGCGCFWFKK